MESGIMGRETAGREQWGEGCEVGAMGTPREGTMRRGTTFGLGARRDEDRGVGDTGGHTECGVTEAQWGWGHWGQRTRGWGAAPAPRPSQRHCVPCTHSCTLAEGCATHQHLHNAVHTRESSHLPPSHGAVPVCAHLHALVRAHTRPCALRRTPRHARRWECGV